MLRFLSQRRSKRSKSKYNTVKSIGDENTVRQNTAERQMSDGFTRHMDQNNDIVRPIGCSDTVRQNGDNRIEEHGYNGVGHNGGTCNVNQFTLSEDNYTANPNVGLITVTSNGKSFDEQFQKKTKFSKVPRNILQCRVKLLDGNFYSVQLPVSIHIFQFLYFM